MFIMQWRKTIRIEIRQKKNGNNSLAAFASWLISYMCDKDRLKIKTGKKIQ